MKRDVLAWAAENPTGKMVSKETLNHEDLVRRASGLGKKAHVAAGFAISSCGGLHGNIPMPNLEAYFDARAEIGATPADWRNRCRA